MKSGFCGSYIIKNLFISYLAANLEYSDEDCAGCILKIYSPGYKGRLVLHRGNVKFDSCLAVF